MPRTLAVAFALAARATIAQETSSPEAVLKAQPIEHADELKSKATASVYLLPGHGNFDLNLRHRFGKTVGWVGAFVDPGADGVVRVGAEYDWQRGRVLLVPTVQAATNGLKAGQIYSELGGGTYAILGWSGTNLKPFFNLSWDPNESLQLGMGRRLNAYDKLYGFTIFDVRLHTGQQDTHVLWRHRLSPRDSVTFDVLYKSGLTDDGRHIHALGVGAYYDRPHTLWKAYYDPHVNFTADSIVRLGVGWKF